MSGFLMSLRTLCPYIGSMTCPLNNGNDSHALCRGAATSAGCPLNEPSINLHTSLPSTKTGR